MAYCTRLSNGYVVMLLSPRESAMLRDQVLQPEDFPWQSTEAQMVALDVRGQLSKILMAEGSKDLKQALQLLAAEEAAASEGEMTKPLAPPQDDDEEDL